VQFVDKARLLLAEHDDLLHGFAGTGADYRRPLLAVGSTEHAADQFLPKLLTAFDRTFPGHEMSFVLQRSSALIDAVQRGDLDLAVVLALNADAPGTRVGLMRLRWAIGVDTVLPDGRQTVALVAFEDPCAIRARAVDLLAGAGVTVRVAAQAATLDGVLAATRAGLGIALLPIAAALPAGLAGLDGLPDPGEIAVHLVSREGLPDTVTHTAMGMVTAFLDEATDPDAPAPSAPPSRRPGWRRIG
jgi:DNA-binding transcriptional LysR family regulator